MTWYYVNEVHTDSLGNRTAGVKARADANRIMKNAGFREITVVAEDPAVRGSKGGLDKALDHLRICRSWMRTLKDLENGDGVVFQFPVIDHTILFFRVVNCLKNRGIRIALLIHDLDVLRAGRRRDFSPAIRMRLKIEEVSILKKVSFLIAHNEKMAEHLAALGADRTRILNLQIFDYLAEDDPDGLEERSGRDLPVVIAGTLRRHKAGYVYHLPEKTPFRLYGVGYEGKQGGGIEYLGSFEPDELPGKLSGSFGLVWDGESAETCSGIYGDYLKINDPHKASLYLAAGLPVMIWEEAALADFIRENNCGITIASLNGISERLKDLTEEEYRILRKNAEETGERLRNGEFLTACLRQLPGSV